MDDLMGQVIDANGKKALLNYKYTSCWKSWIDNKIMNPFWEFVVLGVPLSVAPNTLTVSATIVFLWAYVCWQYFCPNLDDDCPAWVYFQLSVALFIYQTLDAIDGKQARRTGSSSPLGQLFDHGNDALAFTPMLIAGIGASGYKLGWIFFLTLKAGFITFYMVNWRARHEGVMHHPPVGVTEGQFTGIGVYFLAGVFTPHMWDIELPIVGMELRTALAVYIIGVAIYVSIEGYIGLKTYFKTHARAVDRGADVELLQVLLWTVASTLWFYSGAMLAHPRTFLWIECLVFSGLVHRLIVADVTRMYTKTFPCLLAVMPVIAVLCFAESVVGVQLVPVSMTSTAVMRTVFAYQFICWFGYVTRVINEICQTCDIYLFTLGKRSAKTKKSAVIGSAVSDSSSSGGSKRKKRKKQS